MQNFTPGHVTHSEAVQITFLGDADPAEPAEEAWRAEVPAAAGMSDRLPPVRAERLVDTPAMTITTADLPLGASGEVRLGEPHPMTAQIELRPVPRRPGVFDAYLDGRRLTRSRQPLLAAARVLRGEDWLSNTIIECRHVGSDVTALRASLGAAARLTINERHAYGLCRRLWRQHPRAASTPLHGGPAGRSPVLTLTARPLAP
jgi:hypothetical protein